METVSHFVSNLEFADRSAIERLLGHPLADQQQLVIQVIEGFQARRPITPPLKSLPDWCNVFEGATEAELDDISQSIRRDYSSRSIEI